MSESRAKVEAALRALKAIGDRSRAGALDDAEALSISVALREHAQSKSDRVRKVTAEVLLHAPDAIFEELIDRLRQDPNAFVSAEAERTHKARSEQRLTARKRENKSAGLREQRAAFVDKHGAGVLRDANRLSLMEREAFLMRLRHELAKARDNVRGALGRIIEGARGPVVDGLQIEAEAKEALESDELIDTIVNAAQSFTHVPTTEYAPERLVDVVMQAKRMMLDGAGDRRRRIAVDVEVSPELTLDMDRKLVVQALANVLTNALEAYPQNATGDLRIAIGAKSAHAGARVELAVRDWGVGMSEESKRLAGEPFRSSKGGHGRGLGLAYVKKVIDTTHGGRVLIESERGEGTTIRIVLPRAQKRKR